VTSFRIPRLWLVGWLAVGAAGLLYVIVAASVKPGRGAGDEGPPSLGPALLTGEVADFAFAIARAPAPEVDFEHEGRTLSLKAFRGKVTLVNFWATWCAPCLKELPSLDALERDLGGPDFVVVAIAADARGPEIAASFLDRLGIESLKLYRDPRLRLTAAIGGANVLPVSILYDRQGREIGRLVGEADWSAPEARRLISSAIAAR
jgi:thiol-disulfide isomerase/thioredoxin